MMNPDGTFGARITEPTLPSTPAFRLGLRKADVILCLDRERFRSPEVVLEPVKLSRIEYIDSLGRTRKGLILLP